jgi:hypothetical protein
MAAPLGNQNACRSNREYRNALLRTLKQYEASGTPRGEALNQVTTRLVELALKGEPWAIKEIADRVDGKPSLALRTENSVAEGLTLTWKN